MQNLQLPEGGQVELRSILRPPAGSFVRFRPHDDTFLEVAARQVKKKATPTPPPPKKNNALTRARTETVVACITQIVWLPQSQSSRALNLQGEGKGARVCSIIM